MLGHWCPLYTEAQGVPVDHSFLVKKIFAGGDQSFATFSMPYDYVSTISQCVEYKPFTHNTYYTYTYMCLQMHAHTYTHTQHTHIHTYMTHI